EWPRCRVAPRMLKTLFRFKLIFVACAAVLAASPALAQGGGGFGVTLGDQNLGSRYPGDEGRDAGGCVWWRQWIVDDRGRRILRRIRICY
ncbi:MAG: hypothetical protein WA478_14620, partial [Pseudolabrys sp.]